MDKREYLLYMLWNPDLNEEAIAEEIEKMKKVIEKGDNTISSVGAPKRKRLAHPIKNKKECFFSKLVINMNKDTIAKLKEHYKYDENILRYQLLRKN